MIRFSHRVIFTGFLFTALFASHAARAGEPKQQTAYVPFPSTNQLALFDEEANDEVFTVSYVGLLNTDDACVASRFVDAAADQEGAVTLQMPAEATLSAPKDNMNLALGAEGVVASVKEAGSASFVLLYQLVKNPAVLAKIVAHPLDAAQCAANGVVTATVGTVAEGLQTGDARLIGLGGGRLMVAVVTAGAGFETSAATVGQQVGNYARRFGTTLDDALATLALPTLRASGSVLAWDAVPVFVGAIPVESAVAVSRVAVNSATGVAAGLGISMNMSGTSGASGRRAGGGATATPSTFHRSRPLSIADESDLQQQAYETELTKTEVSNNGSLNLKSGFANKRLKSRHHIPEMVNFEKDGFVYLEIPTFPDHGFHHIRLKIVRMYKEVSPMGTELRVVFEADGASFTSAIKELERLLNTSEAQLRMFYNEGGSPIYLQQAFKL